MWKKDKGAKGAKDDEKEGGKRGRQEKRSHGNGESEGEDKSSSRNREIITLALIVVLFILVRMALLYLGAWLGENRERELIQLKMSALTDIVSDADSRRTYAAELVSDKMASETGLMTTMLREFCEEDGSYSGPRTFRHGFVAELTDDGVSLPPEAESLEPRITREMIERDLVAHGLRQGQTLVLERRQGDETLESHYVRFGIISGNYVYADMLDAKEYGAYLERYSGHIDEILQTADESFGGITLQVTEKDGEYRVVRQFGDGADFDTLTDADIQACIEQDSSIVTLNDQDYNCSVSQLGDIAAGEENTYIVQMIPEVSLRQQNNSRALIIVILMLIIIIAIWVYMTSIQHRREDGAMDEEEARHFEPAKLRGRMIWVGILSVVGVFLAAVLVESLGQLYMELRYGRDTLRLFAGEIEREGHGQVEDISREEEAWFVAQGQEMAALISVRPGLGEPDMLQRYCDILDVDSIMLFDSKGDEYACNRDYVGFTLTGERKDAESLSDFQDLLFGVESIVHEASVDERTRLDRQLIGVKVPSHEAKSLHGALIMALLPERVSDSALALEDGRTFSFDTARGTKCLGADAETGEILYASASSMQSKLIGEYGLPERSLQDGYMDFTSIGGTDVLVITVRVGDCVYYYAVESGTMFDRVMLYGAICALLFAIILALLLVFLLRGDNEKAMEELSRLATHERKQNKRLKTDERDAVTIVSDSEPEAPSGKTGGILERISEFFHWSEMLPQERSGLVVRIGIVILIVCCLDVLSEKGLANESYETLLGFLLHGDWMRGLNLFSLCSCILIVAIAYLVNLVSSLVLKLTGILFAGRSETICRLVYSCVKYVTLIGVIYFCMEYLGFPTATILAAFASVSLAFSLGAQDLIADILAGLAIVFDGSFKVGDVVEIGGRKGTVLELGVRSTRLRVPVNNIFMINNHEIKDIINLSKEYSDAHVDFRVLMDRPLEELKEVLNRELPAIGERCDMILYGPYLIGVIGLPDKNQGQVVEKGPVITLRVGSMCEEKYTDEVTIYLNGELKLLSERENIEFM